MASLKLLDLSLVLLLCLLELHVVVLVKVLVLLDMSLLDFLLALLMAEQELLVLHVEFLLLELLNAVLRHFSLYYTNDIQFSFLPAMPRGWGPRAPPLAERERILTNVSAFFFARGPVLLHRGAIKVKGSRVKASSRGRCQKTTHKHDTII